MIASFGNRETEKIWHGERIKSLPLSIQEAARRKLRMLHNSQDLIDVSIPPSNRLEKLQGKWHPYYSIRINDQWRIVFKWVKNHAYDVTIIDYH